MSSTRAAERCASSTRAEVQAFFSSLAPDTREDVPSKVITPTADRILACSLHNYQKTAVAWAVSRERTGHDAHGVRGGVLAEEMGLGKTIEVFGLLVENAPCSVEPMPPATHPLRGGTPLVHGACEGEAFVSAACAVCARRFASREPLHYAADYWAVCRWCLLPHVSALAVAADGAGLETNSTADRSALAVAEGEVASALGYQHEIQTDDHGASRSPGGLAGMASQVRWMMVLPPDFTVLSRCLAC